MKFLMPGPLIALALVVALAVGARGADPVTNPYITGGICDAKILPLSLDTPAYLGSKSSVDLSGEFWIDTSALKHEMTFSLTRESTIRVYVEPHKIDIDVWLYSVSQDGAETLVDAALGFNSEEVVARVLPGGTLANPKKYLIRFRYIPWESGTFTDCESFELELDVTPKDAAMAEALKWGQRCASVDSWPSTAPVAVEGVDKTIFSTDGGTLYTVRAPAAGSGKKGSNYFWSAQVSIAGSAGKVPVVMARVGSRFFLGQVNVMLERMVSAGGALKPAAHCTTPETKGMCVVGDSSMNNNFLEKVVEPGTYTLWLYEPIVQNPNITQCSLFEFAASVRYVPAERTLWECAATAMPTDFGTPGYLTSRGSMHVLDDFMPASASSGTTFKIAKRSLLRVDAGDGAAVSMTGKSGVRIDSTPSIATVLDPDTYSLLLTPSERSACGKARMEIAVEPVDSLPADETCQPSSPTAPTLPLPVTVPYHAGANPDGSFTTYFASMDVDAGKNVIVTYTLSPAVDALLSANAMSSFLKHSVYLSLWGTTADGRAYEISGSELGYNEHMLQQVLSAGKTYTLNVALRTPQKRPTVGPLCVPYNFELHLVAYDSSNPAHRCATVPGTEDPPTTFDTRQFLQPSGEMDYGATKLRIPANWTFWEPRKDRGISFTLSKKSFVHVFVEPHKAADIDIKVVDSKGLSVLVGRNFVNTEEAIAGVLLPGVYKLVLSYWFPDRAAIAACATFGLHVAIEPVSYFPPQQCPSSTSQWPPSLSAVPISEKLKYSSVERGDTLCVQQVKGVQGTYTVPFTLAKAFNLYVQVGYAFDVGQVAFRLEKLRRPGGDVLATFYAEPGLHRMALRAKNVEAGYYQLVFYEPVTNPDELLGCLSFSLFVLIDPQSDLYNNDKMSLPANLDGLPYLMFDSALSLFDTFVLFRGTKTVETTTFNLATPSVLNYKAHVHAITMQQAELQPEAVITRASDNAIVDVGKTAEPGKYVLSLKVPAGAGWASVSESGNPVDVGISIIPLSQAQAVVSAMTRRPDEQSLVPTISISPKGTYQYSSNGRVFSWNTFSSSAKTEPLQRLALSVKQQSLVWARIGYDFSLAHLQVRVALADGKTVLVGDPTGNHDTLKVVVPAGEHRLEIHAVSKPAAALERATPFSFSVSVVPADNLTLSGCAMYDTVPWDLNKQDGGSLHFGGPINPNTGYLHMSGTKFGVAKDWPQDKIKLKISSDSLVSLLLVAGDRLGGVRANLVAKGNSAIPSVLPVELVGSISTFTARQAMYTWSLHPEFSNVTEYELQLEYSDVSGACGGFQMQLIIRNTLSLQTSLICESGKTPTWPGGLTPDANGFASSYVDSFFDSREPWLRTASQLAANVTGVNTASRLSVSFSFNSLDSLFNLMFQYYYKNNAQPILRASSLWRSTRGQTGDVTVTQSLIDRLATNDVYSIVIKAANFSQPFVLSPDKAVCIPYSYSAEILPLNGMPFVSEVVPARGNDISFAHPFVFTVTFSEPVYEAAGTPATCESVRKAFNFAQEGKPDVVVPVVACDVVLDGTGTSFSLTVAPKAFKSFTTYRLKFTKDIIYDNEKHAVTFTSANLYRTVDTTCNLRGTLLDDGTCRCDEGYGGANCRTCALGYLDVSTDSSLRCVPAMSCEETTCGCRWVGTTCQKSGTCSIDLRTGIAVCACNKGFAGAYCRTCAKGFDHYPVCDAGSSGFRKLGLAILWIMIVLGTVGSLIAGVFLYRRKKCPVRIQRTLERLPKPRLPDSLTDKLPWLKRAYHRITTDGDEDEMEEPAPAPEIIVASSSTVTEAKSAPKPSSAAAAAAAPAVEDFFKEKGPPISILD